jgi:hypothetical protein
VIGNHRSRGAAGALALAGALAGCGAITQTLQQNQLRSVEAVRGWQVYWVGMRFEGLPLRALNRDPGGAFTAQYGNCENANAACAAPLLIVSTPDPSFVPGAPHAELPTTIRSVPVYATDGGRILHVATGNESVTVTARRATDALAAVDSMDALNNGGSSASSALPSPQPNAPSPLDQSNG